MRTSFLFVGLLLINLFLFAGGKAARLKKADFFAKFVFYPLVSQISNSKQKKQLKKENDVIIKRLTQTTIELQLLQNQLEKYREIAKINLNGNFDYQIANVVGKGNLYLEKTLIIDKGYTDNIEKDFPVINFYGIIGKIIAVGKDYSIVLPYSNPNFHLSVMISKNNEQGILKSNSVGKVFVDYLSLDSEISVGDTVITSNLSQIFPEGFLVGKIKKISISKDKMHKIAELQMFNNPEALRTVAVINFKKEKYYEQKKQRINS